jgi:hypothetical protein
MLSKYHRQLSEQRVRWLVILDKYGGRRIQDAKVLIQNNTGKDAG